MGSVGGGLSKEEKRMSFDKKKESRGSRVDLPGKKKHRDTHTHGLIAGGRLLPRRGLRGGYNRGGKSTKGYSNIHRSVQGK